MIELIINDEALLSDEKEIVQLFDSMFEYCKDADISNYKLTISKELADWENGYSLISNNEDREYIIGEFKPIDDNELSYDYREERSITFNDKKYYRIYWGETETCYILDGAEDEILYTVYEKYDAGKYSSCGIVFENEEQAKEWIEK